MPAVIPVEMRGTLAREDMERRDTELIDARDGPRIGRPGASIARRPVEAFTTVDRFDGAPFDPLG